MIAHLSSRFEISSSAQLRRARFFISRIAIIGLAISAGAFEPLLLASAQQTSVVNIPPSPNIERFAYILDGTTTNLFDGGSIGDFVTAVTGSKLNVYGGLIGDFFHTLSGNVTNLYGGAVGRFTDVGGQFNVYGGEIADLEVNGKVNVFGGKVGSTTVNTQLNVHGGSIDITYAEGGRINIDGGVVRFTYLQGSTVNLSGGVLKPFFGGGSGTLNVSGGDFRLDGQPIPGLDVPGTSLQLNPTHGQVVSGVLADGTPFAFSDQVYDEFLDGVLWLKLASLPAIGPSKIIASVDPVPAGLRGGQTLVVDAGVSPEYLQAGWGSSVRVVGGRIPVGLEAVGANVSVSDGSIGSGFHAYSSTNIDLTGGVIGDSMRLFSNARMRIAGGAVGPFFSNEPGSELIIEGGELRLDGAPLVTSLLPGEARQFDIPENAILTGTLTDGTPFSAQGWHITDNTLTLKGAIVPPVGPPLIVAAIDPVPQGIRAGQSLVVGAGAVLKDYFVAGWDSKVKIEGGRVGVGLQATHATVEYKEGATGEAFNATLGSDVLISDHSTVHGFSVDRGSSVTVEDSTISATFVVGQGGHTTIRSGVISDYVIVQPGGTIDIFGGTFGPYFEAYNDSNVTFYGTRFSVNGVDITSTMSLNLPFGLTDRNVALTGELADGTLFRFQLDPVPSAPYFDPQARLNLVLVPEQSCGTIVLLAALLACRFEILGSSGKQLIPREA